MDNFCGYCGKKLNGGPKFCPFCGNPTQVKKIQEIYCGKPDIKDTKCIKEIKETKNIKDRSIAKGVIPTIKQNNELLDNILRASDIKGETAFTSSTTLFKGSSVITGVGPFKTFIVGFKAAIKDPKKLLPAFILSLVWFALTLLPKYNIKIPFKEILEWVTFSKGGLTGGNLALVGGVLGKGLFAGLFTRFTLSIFSRKNPFSNLFSGFKSMFSAFNVKGLNEVSLLFLGAGIALILNNFLTGNNSMENSMIGILAMVASIRAVGNKAAMLRKFKLFSKGNSAIAGLVPGFALSVALSNLHISFMSYAVGVFILLVGIVMFIVSKSKKEVA